MPTVVPQQMFNHALDYLKGWPSPTAVDFVAKLSPAVDPTSLPVSGGRVAHLNQSGQFELGAKSTQMPIFLIQGSSDFDVSNPGNGQTDPYGWTAVAPAGWMSGLVSAGSYELQTTEYDTTPGVNYYPNTLLHSPTIDQITGTDKSAAGLLYAVKNWPGGGGGPLVLYTDNVCGVVSRGASLNHFRRQVVSFWPVYLPSP
jgi:hypothetical protein